MTFEELFATLVIVWFSLMCAIHYMDGDEKDKRPGESDSTYRG
jgi:hypothetical protein